MGEIMRQHMLSKCTGGLTYAEMVVISSAENLSASSGDGSDEAAAAKDEPGQRILEQCPQHGCSRAQLSRPASTWVFMSDTFLIFSIISSALVVAVDQIGPVIRARAVFG